MAAPASRRPLVAAALVLAAAAIVSGTPCPSEWNQSGAWCYLTNTSSELSWAGAAALCQERGGSLVTIQNRSRLLDVVDLLKAVGIDKRWWIGIKKTSGSTSVAERNASIYDNFGEEKVEKNASGSHQCVLLSAGDGLWYWDPCDSPRRYVCQRAADRVAVVQVTPERRRPSLAWLRAHEAALLAALTDRDSRDDKGEFSASKATMTPLPPPTVTTPLPTTSAGGGGDGGSTTATTPSPCTGDRWWLLDTRCHHMFLDAKTYADAERVCDAKGGHLTRFDNEAAQATFRERYNLISGSIWIGLSRPSSTQPFQWADGTAPAYRAWVSAPAAGNSTCAALDLNTNKWIVADCAAPKPFSCCRSVDATERPPAETTTPAPVTAAPCGGGGWWRHGPSCLLLVTDSPASWHAAEQDCRNRSATQVKIDSSEVNQHIRGKLSGVSAWIGLSKLNAAGTFQWTDGSAASYTNWIGGADTTTGAEMASCARLDAGTGNWRPVNCNAPQPYVCQRPADGSAVPPPRLPPPPPRSSCPGLWRPYGADRCLLVTNTSLTWAAARQWCRTQAAGADLLSVPNAVHQAFLTSTVRDSVDNLWISLSYDELDRRRFLTWTDESAVNYTNWAPGQPSTPCESCPRTCGVVDGRQTSTPAAWSDIDCNMTFGAVCQRPATPNNSIVVTQSFCNNTDSQYIAAAAACYKIVKEEKTWQEAADACQEDGSALAYVGDLFDNAELVKLLHRDKGQYWLGLSDTARHGMMEWTRPWPAAAVFLNWDPAQERQPSRDSCAALQASSGLWQQRDCALDRRPFVCQRAPQREAAPAAAGRCPAADGRWVAGETRCYRAFEPGGAGLSWSEASTDCERRGYRLASVSSVTDFRAVREAVLTLSSRFTAWIALRSQQDKEYGWRDGSPLTYRAWRRSEPVQSAGCAVASRLEGGRWQTVACTRRTAYLCMTDMTTPGTDAITGEAAGGGGGGRWAALVVVLLALVLALAAGLWLARRRRLRWLPSWLQLPRGAHHSVENLAYSRNPASADSSDGALNHSNLEAIAAHRWGSQEQLVVSDG